MHVMSSWLADIGLLTDEEDHNLKQKAKEFVRLAREEALDASFNEARSEVKELISIYADLQLSLIHI